MKRLYKKPVITSEDLLEQTSLACYVTHEAQQGGMIVPGAACEDQFDQKSNLWEAAPCTDIQQVPAYTECFEGLIIS